MKYDRGVSVTLSYVILLAVATTMLISRLMVTGGLLDSQNTHAVHDELTVAGESLAGEIELASRLYGASGTDVETLEVKKALPRQVSGSSYRIYINGSSDQITLSTTRPDVSVTIEVNSNYLPDEEQSIRGGPVVMQFDDGEMEVSADG